MTGVHHIVFHDDVDGIVSAALYLHNHVGDGSYRLYPIMSSNRGEKFNDIVRDMRLTGSDRLVVLDYESHPRADLWVDHHWDRRMGDEPVHNDKIHYDPSAKSAARLVHDGRPERHPPYNDAFLATVEMIDQAAYRTVEQIFTDTHPLMILRAHLERSFPSEMMKSRVVEMLSRTHFDVKEANYRLKLDASCVRDLKADVYKAKRDMTIFGGISVIHQRRPNQFPRYAEFMIRPETRYAVRVSRIGNRLLYLQIGYNKWFNVRNDVNIGSMLNQMRYLVKGGGHYNVGGGLLKESDEDRFLDDLDITLNGREELPHMKDGDEMEKVGVDREADPVEAKAEEMVKSGEAESLPEARETVLSDSEQPESKDPDSAVRSTQ